MAGTGLPDHATVHIGNDEMIEAVGNRVEFRPTSRYCYSSEIDCRKYSFYVIRPGPDIARMRGASSL